MHFLPQLLTPITHVFTTDLNADVTLVTVPHETLSSWEVFVMEAPAIHAPWIHKAFYPT